MQQNLMGKRFFDSQRRPSLPPSLVIPPAASKRPRRQRRAASPLAAGSMVLLSKVVLLGKVILLGSVLGSLACSPALAQPRRSGSLAAAAPLAVAPELAAKLRSPLSSAVTAKPLRPALVEIAAVAKVNLWIDHRVDPHQVVTVAAGPKSVFETLDQAAESVGLQAIAAANVVLVGRPAWAQTLAGAIHALPPAAREPAELTTTRWPELTTPTEALAIALASDIPDTLTLPHDLWPEVAWDGVSAPLAALLIGAQFDRMPSEPLHAATPARATLVPLAAPAAVTCAYPEGPFLAELRAAARAADPACRFRPSGRGGPLLLTGSAQAHAAATTAALRHQGGDAPATADVDATRFSLRLRDARAQDVFAQLAATAGRQLAIAPAASEAALQRVTLEGRDVTLRELTQQVAAAVGLHATWTAAALQIEPAP